jgi:DNA-binding NarL/FixJ family response regulator
MITIKIVDDHRLVVESLSKLIGESGIALVTGVYYDIQSCRRGLIDDIPDILLLDIGLPDGDGVEFCDELTRRYTGLKIIMLSTYKEFSIAKRALHNGAMGYILKNSESEELLAGITMVNSGERFLCEEIDILLKKKRDEEVVWFTNREKEVLKYISDGLTSKEIGIRIFRDEETVRINRRNLLLKLKAKNTPEAVKKGFEMKIIW